MDSFYMQTETNLNGETTTMNFNDKALVGEWEVAILHFSLPKLQVGIPFFICSNFIESTQFPDMKTYPQMLRVNGGISISKETVYYKVLNNVQNLSFYMLNGLTKELITTDKPFTCTLHFRKINKI